MSSKPTGPQDLHNVFSERKATFDAAHDRQTTMVELAEEGILPVQYIDYFPDGMHVHIPDHIRTAATDLSGAAAKPFPYYVPPRNDSAKAKKEAELAENIHYGYRDASRRCGGPSWNTLMRTQVAYPKILMGDAVLCVWPHYEKKTPYFEARDPRTHYPPVGWTPMSRNRLNGTLFAYMQTLGQLKALYPDKAAAISAKMNKTTVGMGAYSFGVRSSQKSGDAREVWVCEYYHDDAWYVSIMDGEGTVLAASETGDKGHPGICPVVAMTDFAHGQPKGRPMMHGQVSLVVAQARILSQQIDYHDEAIYAETYIIGDVDISDVNKGPGAVTIINPTGGGQADVKKLGPTNSVQSDQTLMLLQQMTRQLNRNPEAMQGAGPADSGKAIDRLLQNVASYIQDVVWPDLIAGEERAQYIAAQMDTNLWGNEKKSASGKDYNNYKFAVDYTPNVHIKPYLGDLTIEQGLGLGGYQGKLETMQLLGSGLISKHTALERLPDIQNPIEEMRRIQSGQLEELTFADLGMKAQNGLLQPAALAELKKMVEGGQDLFEAIGELEAAGRLSMQPPGAEAGLPGGGGEVDPLAALMGAMGGGQDALAQGAVPEGTSLRGLRGQ